MQFSHLMALTAPSVSSSVHCYCNPVSASWVVWLCLCWSRYVPHLFVQCLRYSVTAHKMCHAWNSSEFRDTWHFCNLTYYLSPCTCVNERYQGSFCTVLVWILEMWFAFRHWWCLIILTCQSVIVTKLCYVIVTKLCSVSCSSWTLILDFGFDCCVKAGGLP